ncbi:MAG: hypothetical protein IPM57_12550 [Oligoflexia bacterium]|nr:hypothetical protein [Oligoflexia bacterium]
MLHSGYCAGDGVNLHQLIIGVVEVTQIGQGIDHGEIIAKEVTAMEPPNGKLPIKVRSVGSLLLKWKMVGCGSSLA